MSPRNLFVVILKIFGIYLFVNAIDCLLKFSIWLEYMANGRPTGIFFYTLLETLFYATISYTFLFKPSIVIDKLKLGEGFEDWNFSFFKQNQNDNIDGYFIVNLSIWITAVYILITEIPKSLSVIASTNAEERIQFILKIIIALLLVGYNKQIARYLDNQNSKEKAKEENS